MKAAKFSNLHLAFSFPDPIALPDGTDVLIVAGDVSAPVAKSMAWLHERFTHVPTVYVAGNHDHYGQIFAESMESGRRAALEYPNIHFLENDEVVINNVRFLGATMWTDYELYGDKERAMSVAHDLMNDYRQIYDVVGDGQLMPWKPERTRVLHHESRAWLRSALGRPHDGPTVVVTHHCPHRFSVAPQYWDDDLTPSFASDLDAEIRQSSQRSGFTVTPTRLSTTSSPTPRRGSSAIHAVMSEKISIAVGRLKTRPSTCVRSSKSDALTIRSRYSCLRLAGTNRARHTSRPNSLGG